MQDLTKIIFKEKKQRKPTGKTTNETASFSNFVTDIFHLVRKKRKSEKEVLSENDAKKAEQDLEVNGSSGGAVLSGSEVSKKMETMAQNQTEILATAEET